MARRSKALDSLIGVVAILGLVGFAVTKFFEHVGYVVPLVVVAGAVAFYWWRRHEAAKAGVRAAEVRRAALLAKYNDPQVVSKILAKEIWIGQTGEQVRDSIGEPHDTDQKVLKTKKKEVWKYGHKGGGRYMYRITLDNDVVVGWDEKA